MRSHVEPSLLKALARAREWYGWILAGEADGPTSIARRTGLNERYVGKVLQCAFLAPDIVEAMIGGRQPQDLTQAAARRTPVMHTAPHDRSGGPGPEPAVATESLSAAPLRPGSSPANHPVPNPTRGAKKRLESRADGRGRSRPETRAFPFCAERQLSQSSKTITSRIHIRRKVSPRVGWVICAPD